MILQLFHSSQSIFIQEHCLLFLAFSPVHRSPSDTCFKHCSWQDPSHQTPTSGCISLTPPPCCGTNGHELHLCKAEASDSSPGTIHGRSTVAFDQSCCLFHPPPTATAQLPTKQGITNQDSQGKKKWLQLSFLSM